MFWVIGTDTNVGKSTLAAALIRVLNRRGTPTVGFKPFGGTLLQEMMDTAVERRERSGCEFCGHDAEMLAEASPLTPVSMMDVVGPFYCLGYPRFAEAIAYRMGSRSLGNVRYLRNRRSVELMERPDVVALLESVGVPIRTIEPSVASFADAPSFYPRAQADAFAELLRLGPEAVVCEGAGRFLPAWSNLVVNHILVVTGANVHFIPRINMRADYRPRLQEFLPSMLDQLLAFPTARTRPMPLAVSADRERAAEALATICLEQSGLLAPA
jgi:hypothetical protein